MQKLVFRNPNGEEIDFTSGDFGVTRWEGFSHTDMEVQSQQVPFHDGSVFLDALLAERELSITVAVNDNGDLEKRYRLKRELIHCLNPKLGEGELIYTNDYTSKKIVCVPAIPEFENKNMNDRGTLKASCSFTASSPYWEDVEETEVYFDAMNQVTVENKGDVPCNIKADIIGINAKNPRLKNVTTKQNIKFNGTIENSLSINTNFWNKKVESEKLDYNLLLGGSFKGIVCNDELTVIVGNFILASKDGEEWIQKYSGISEVLNGICWSNALKLFVAVGNNGSIVTSNDGSQWEVQTSGTADNLFSVCYSDDLEMFVIAGDSGTILTSEDGETWTAQTSGTSSTLSKVIYGANILIAVGGSDTIITSPDGVTWTSRTAGLSTDSYTSICYSDDLEMFVMGTYTGKILTSADGITWAIIGAITNDVIRSVIYSPMFQMFIAVRSSSIYKTAIIFTSPDGITWTQGKSINDEIYDILYSTNIDSFCIAGNNGMVALSQNLSDWEEKRNALLRTIYSICYSDKLGLFCIVGSSGFIAISEDGFNWEPITPLGTKAIYDVVYAKDMFVAVGSKGYDFGILTSTDGRTWNDTGAYKELYLESICYSEDLDLFCVVGTNGDSYNKQAGILVSSDGENWTIKSAPVITCKDYKQVIYSKTKEKFYAVGEHDGIISSADGTTWTSVSPSPSDVGNNNLMGICYSDKLDLFVCTGQNEDVSDYTSLVLTSTDGTTWERQKFNKKFTKIAYNDKINLFCIPEMDGNNLLSTNGFFWDEQESNSMIPQKIIFIGSLASFYVVGDAVLGSYFTNFQNQIANITEDSDMDLKLVIGENIIRFVSDNGIGNIILKYTQKYLGV